MNVEENIDYINNIHDSYIKELQKQDKYFKELQQENKKYKEVIDKAIDYVENGDLLYLASKCSVIYRNNIEVVAVCDRLNELLEILKEVNDD